MSYTDEAVRAKLSALHDTQDSIVTVAQWIMFHRRYADRTANLWMQKLKDSNAAKKLNLIYLANEVVQQSKAKKRDEFLNAFTPIIVESVTEGYKGSPIEIQGKIRRVVDVWRQRLTFDPSAQEALEAAIDGLEKSRPTAQRKALGGSLFSTDASSGSIPAALLPIVQVQQTIEKAQLVITPSAQTAEKDYTALTTGPLPSPPLLAARLSALAKSLVTAETALTDSLNARGILISSLEKLLADNKLLVDTDENRRAGLRARRTEIEAKKAAVEDAIMRGLAVPGTDPYGGGLDIEPPSRPDVERFTPPPVEHPTEESTTPVGSPAGEDQLPERETSTPPPPPAVQTSTMASVYPVYTPLPSVSMPLTPLIDPWKALDPRRRGAGGSPGGETNGHMPPVKKRKTSEDDFLAGDGGALDGLDAEVVGMLG